MQLNAYLRTALLAVAVAVLVVTAGATAIIVQTPLPEQGVAIR